MKFSRWRFVCLLLVWILTSAVASPTQAADPDSPEATTQTTYLLKGSVIGSAGTVGGSTNFTSMSTLGQPLITGRGTSDDVVYHDGFWALSWLTSSVVDIENPVTFVTALYQNYPNPFRSSTAIVYSLARKQPVRVTVFNVLGRRIKTLANSVQDPGVHRIAWEGRDNSGVKLASGVYFYEFKAGETRTVKKLVILR